MIVTIGGIPVYNAVISDGETGMLRISLVDDPAVMSNFQSFDNKRKPMMYAIADEEKRLVRGVVMRADFPIYRYSPDMGEFYIMYKADQIRVMAEKYLSESRQNNVNLMHEEGSDVEGVQMVQYFIKGDGVSVAGFDDIADGSLFAEFHVVNDTIWEEIKAGTYKGFSLEGIFDLVPEQDIERTKDIVDILDGLFSRIFKNSNNHTMSKLSRLKTALMKAFAEFGNITTDKGILTWDGEDDIAVGVSVFIEDEQGNNTPAEDGDYKTDDGKVIVVADGVVAEIKDAEVEPAPEPSATPEPEQAFGDTIDTDKGTLVYEGESLEVGTAVYMVDPESPEAEAIPAPDGEYETEDKVLVVKEGVVSEINDKPAPEPEPNPEMEELRKENNALKAENAELKKKVEEMQKISASKPAHQEYEGQARVIKTGNKGLDNIARYMSAK